jgi:hypothetical protein
VGHAVYDYTLSSTNANFTGVGAWFVQNLTMGVTRLNNLRAQLVIDNLFR